MSAPTDIISDSGVVNLVLAAVAVAIGYVMGFSHGWSKASLDGLERLTQYIRHQNDAAEALNRELISAFGKVAKREGVQP